MDYLPNTEPQQVGARLRLVRRHVGVSQRTFAHMLSAHTSTYQTWEMGQNRLPYVVALRVKEIFPVTTDWLYSGDTTFLHGWVIETLEDVSRRLVGS